MLSKSESMRLPFFTILCAFWTVTLFGATQVPPGQSVPPAAAEPGKDVVHQLSNAFARVFETVAPGVVIIEVSKKNDGEPTTLDDLFFQSPDQNQRRQNRQNLEPIQSEGSGFIVKPD